MCWVGVGSKARFCLITLLVTYFCVTTEITARTRISYFVTEHPNVTFYDKRYIKYANLTSRRYGRKDPFYYVGVHFELLTPADNTIWVHFYFYELLTNVYKRGFIEMHMSFCDMILNNAFFGPALRKNMDNIKHCPLLPGVYHWYNMTIPIEQVPRGFPFTKGRIYCNITCHSGVIVSGYINLELKQITKP